uniref:proteasome endopeptidase complex n=1 Tax=Chlamydomonas euryale TaxID=1486919 RepID=A0A7R9VDR5_9CHLO
MACVYDGGVVLGADGRVSVGNYISNRSSNKIAPLAERVFLLRSGSAPDAQIVSDHVSFYVHNLEAEQQLPMSVETVAKLVMQINYQNKDNLIGALIIAGYDEEKKGQVFGCPIGGTLSNEKWAVDGSGSTFIWGYCDAAYRDNFTRAEAEAFVEEGVALAMSSDCSSGGCIRLVTVNSEGAHHKYINGSQAPKFQDELNVPGPATGGMILG